MEEYSILLCKQTPSLGEGEAGVRTLAEIERSFLLALERAMRHRPAIRYVSPQALGRALAESRSGGEPLVVCILEPAPNTDRSEEAKALRNLAESVRDTHLFILLSSVHETKERLRALEGLRLSIFPDKDRSPESATEFWRVMNDLVEDVTRALKPEKDAAPGPGIFIAPASAGEILTAGKLRRDLENRGFFVRSVTELRTAEPIDPLLDGMALSVHLFGSGEAGTSAADHAMDVFHLALAYSKTHPDLRVLGWTDALHDVDRSNLSEQILREALEFSSRAEIVKSSIEDFKSLLFDRLGGITPVPSASGQALELPVPSMERENRELYLIFDPRDTDSIPPVTNFLQEQGIAVLLSEYPQDQTKLRAIHHENLRRCDAALIIYGGVQEQWVRMKQQDLLRSAALGRQKRLSAKGVFLCSKRTESKLRFSAPDLMVINGFDSAAALTPFIQRLSAA